MKLKNVLLTVTSFALVAALAIGGTIAYLQDTDEDVNVMTLGNVSIDQLEYERVVEDDAWVSVGEADKYGYTPDELKEFSQAKPLYPAVFADGNIKWDDRNGSQNASGAGSHQQSWGQVGASGSNQLFDDSVKNVQDKIVFVKNTGKSDAYVRTWFAFEQGAVAAEDFKNVIMTNSNKNHWSWETVATDVEIEGNKYFVMLATYLGPKSNPNGILAPGAVSYPSLLQVYMRPEATNEDVEAIDGNKNGTYDILVLSQAIQTAGFEAPATTYSLNAPATAAEVALNEGYGTDHPWEENGVELPIVVNSFADLKNAGRNGGNFVLGADIEITDKNEFFYGSYVTAIYKDMVLDLNGHSITIDVDMGSTANAPILFYVYDSGASLTVVGDGDVIAKNDAFIFFPRGVSEGLYIYGGNYYNIDDTSGTKNDINAIVYSQTNDNIHIYGGTFTFKNVSGHCGGFNIYDNSGAEIVLHEGVLLSNSNYYKGSDADEIHLAEGCTLEETVVNGQTWYKVVKK